LRRRGHLCQDDRKYHQSAERNMSSVARVTEIIASSKKSFDDAIDSGVRRATKTLKNVAGAWVASQDVLVVKGKIAEYRVRLKVTFVLAE
jgi:flavin-binding protein dodecin